jgi:hypothetical protein
MNVSFQFQFLPFIESLQGVHRARGECQKIKRNFSVRNPLDPIY